MAETPGQDWTIVLVLTALVLSVAVLGQILTRYATAYMAAPREIAIFIDTVDFSIQENESFDTDVGKVQRLEDKIRLGRLLREIQKSGDDLREDLNRILIAEGGTTLRTSARLLWAAKKTQLEDRVRRLDLLRMRFLVVYMGIITGATNTVEKQNAGQHKDPEKSASIAKPSLPRALTDVISKKPPLRRLTTQAIGHNDNVVGDHRRGWIGVVQELQRSPRMHQRHASIETAMSKTP